MMIADIKRLSESLKAFQRSFPAWLISCRANHVWRAICPLEQGDRVQFNHYFTGAANQIGGCLQMLFNNLAM